MDKKTLTKCLNRAKVVLKSNNWLEVITQLEPIKNELNLAGKIILATAYIRLKKYAETVLLLGPVKDNLKVTDKSNLATAYRNLGRYKEEAKLLESVKTQLDAININNLAIAYNNLGQFKEARELLRLLKLLKNQSPKAIGQSESIKDAINLATVYTNLEEFNQALRLLNPLKNKLSEMGKGLLAINYFNVGQFSQAIDFVKKFDEPFVTEMFITNLFSYLKGAILAKKTLPFSEDSIIKSEIVALFFKTYLKLKMSKNLLNKQQESLFSQICILALLKFDEIPIVSYYCSAETYVAMFKSTVKEATESKKDDKNRVQLRMSEVSQFNDPLEGQMLSHNKVNTTINEKEVFIKCFSLRINNLNQFRLYGGKEGKPNGVGLVFKPTFFSRKLISLNSSANVNEQQLPLFRMCYLEPIKKSAGYKIHGLATPDITSYFNNGQKDKERKDYQAEILNTDTEIINQLEPLLAGMGKIYIPFLPYLFKDKAFLDEAECRMIYLNQFQDSLQLDKNGHWVYVPYEVPMLQHLEEVYFGPSNKEGFFLRHYLPPQYGIKCPESTLSFV